MKTTFYFILLSLAGLLAIAIIKTKAPAEVQSFSLEPIVKIAGQFPNAASKGVSKVATLADLDEAELGSKLKEQFHLETFSDKNEHKRIYLQSLVDYISKFKKKDFDYRVFILDNEVSNALALPGGVILVTTGLLDTLKSEAEMIAVLAHEMGHIESSHCLNAVKYELLSKKLQLDSLGSNLDLVRNLFLKKTFSKLEEEEADTYSFQLLLLSIYDPSSLSHSLGRLRTESSSNVVEDVFGSHPSLDSRVVKFNEMSKVWWGKNFGKIRYIGRKNYKQYTNMQRAYYGSEESVTQHFDVESIYEK